MTSLKGILHRDRDYWPAAAFASLCAAALAAFPAAIPLPVLGTIPALPVTLAAALAGWPLFRVLRRRGVAGNPPARLRPAHLLRLAGLGAALALLPVAIDLAFPFPRDLNLALPAALFFYPAIAIVAETVFHLLPLTLLALALPRDAPAAWLIAPVVLIEPLFQVLFLPLGTWQSWLVIGNVSAVSIAQLWLFRRHGFAAMIGLRLAFYLGWHIIWGTLRLTLLFA